MAAQPKPKRKQGARELRKEFTQYELEPPENCTFSLISDDIMKWLAKITGPQKSSYDGIFDVELSFPKNYPITPPKAKMLTSIYHLNMNNKGKICCSILDNEWDLDKTVADVVDSIYELLEEPVKDSAINDDALAIFLHNEDEYHKIAKEWTKKYADPNGPPPDQDDQKAD